MAKELCELVEGKFEEHELDFKIKQAPSDCMGIQINEDRPGLNELADLIAGQFQMTIEELQGDNRTLSCVLARKHFIKEAVLRHAYKRAEVARYLKKDRSLLTKVLQRKF